MPAISIDTFFACTLMVSVVIISSVLLTGALNGQMASVKDIYQDEYLRALSEYVLFNTGVPANWGSDSTIKPSIFGLAKQESLRSYELDIDKTSRLNNQNAFALTYPEILKAAGLNNIALGISISQIMNVSISLSANTSSPDSVIYTFRISVNQDGAGVETSLHCYTVAKNFLSDSYNSTSADGTGYFEVELPNASNGTALLVVFARALQDTRITAYGVYSFQHLSSQSQPENTIFNLSPLNYTLLLSTTYSDFTVEKCYAFSYGYQSNLTATTNETYAIPTISETSPMVLVTSASNASTYFINWTSYPQVPLEVGADFQNSESHAFSYLVTIKGTLYKLILRFGGINP
jgi:hypothetical protein